MPTIPRLKKKTPSCRTKERQKYYQDTQYRQQRNWFMQCHPLCQLCEQDGLVEPATQLHHAMSPFDTNISEQEKWRRLKDENNFMALCDYHHRLQHHTTSPEEDREYYLKTHRNIEIF